MGKPRKPLEQWTHKDFYQYTYSLRQSIKREKERFVKDPWKIDKLEADLKEIQRLKLEYDKTHPPKDTKFKEKPLPDSVEKKETSAENHGGRHLQHQTTRAEDAKIAAELCYPSNVVRSILNERDWKKRQKMLQDARLAQK